MGKKTSITGSELAVMNILWETGSSVPTKEIVRKLQAEKDWDRSTIRTLLKRLVEKGVVIQEKHKTYQYKAAVSRNNFTKEQTRGLIDKLYRGSARELVVFLVDSRELTEEDLQELRAYLMEEK